MLQIVASLTIIIMMIVIVLYYKPLMAVPFPSISCCVLNHHNLFYHIQNALAFNWDTCCHLVLCLWLLPFHCKLECFVEATKIRGTVVEHSTRLRSRVWFPPWVPSLWTIRRNSMLIILSYGYFKFKQGVLKGNVLYYWPPVWPLWNQLYDNWQFLFLFAKQANPNRSDRRSMVQWYFPL